MLFTVGLPPWITQTFEILYAIDNNLGRAMLRVPAEAPHNLSPVWHIHDIAMQRIQKRLSVSLPGDITTSPLKEPTSKIGIIRVARFVAASTPFPNLGRVTDMPSSRTLRMTIRRCRPARAAPPTSVATLLFLLANA